MLYICYHPIFLTHPDLSPAHWPDSQGTSRCSPSAFEKMCASPIKTSQSKAALASHSNSFLTSARALTHIYTYTYTHICIYIHIYVCITRKSFPAEFLSVLVQLQCTFVLLWLQEEVISIVHQDILWYEEQLVKRHDLINDKAKVRTRAKPSC